MDKNAELCKQLDLLVEYFKSMTFEALLALDEFKKYPVKVAQIEREVSVFTELVNPELVRLSFMVEPFGLLSSGESIVSAFERGSDGTTRDITGDELTYLF